jgi:hypothetical protein
MSQVKGWAFQVQWRAYRNLLNRILSQTDRLATCVKNIGTQVYSQLVYSLSC